MNETIVEVIKKSLSEEELNNFKEEQIAKGISYKLYSRFIVRLIMDLKKGYRIEITDDDHTVKKRIPNKYTVEEKSDGLLQIDLPKDENILTTCFLDLSDALQAKKQYIINNYAIGLTFGCCSRYMECSDAKKCIHPDAKFARGCQYKSNLDAGRIFYGKNRNAGGH